MSKSPSDLRSLGDCGLRLLRSLLRVWVLQLLTERFGKFTSPLFPEQRIGRVEVTLITTSPVCRAFAFVPRERNELLVFLASFHEDEYHLPAVTFGGKPNITGGFSKFLEPLTWTFGCLSPSMCCWLEILLCAPRAPRYSKEHQTDYDEGSKCDKSIHTSLLLKCREDEVAS